MASDPRLWRTLDEIGEPQRRRIVHAHARTREHVWALTKQRHDRTPPSKAGDRKPGKTIVIGNGHLGGERPLRQGTARRNIPGVLGSPSVDGRA